MSRQSSLISSSKGNSSLALDPIVIPAFDNSDILAHYDLTLSGRVLNEDLQAHRVKALVGLMPQAWNLEGRVQGTDLGRWKFQFRFTTESDLQAVLERRPYYFDQWMFPLERWVPSVRRDFPSTMLFWVRIFDIPPHYKKEATVKGIGEKLGELITWDVDTARVRISMECNVPLQFERRVLFFTGDEIVVTLRYEKLQKYCFISWLMTHTARHCPSLEAEKVVAAKNGYKDRNQKQQAILKEVAPTRTSEKQTKEVKAGQKPKPSARRKLFSENDSQAAAVQETKAQEPTRLWVDRSFKNRNYQALDSKPTSLTSHDSELSSKQGKEKSSQEKTGSGTFMIPILLSLLACLIVIVELEQKN